MDVAGKKLFFSGELSIGSTRHYVQEIPVKSYSIEGYGVDDSPNAIIYIVTSEASNDRTHDIWYRLGTPSRPYKCFQDAFQWIATLGKHTVDFLDHQHAVTLADFKQKFSAWLQQRFPDNPDVSRWRDAYGSTDFRKIIHAHISYMYSEAVCLQDDSLLNHPLWKECGRNDDDMIESKCEKTVATPHVFKCFKNRYFAGQIVEMCPLDAVLAAREHRVRTLGFPSETQPPAAATQLVQNRHKIQIGDVVCIAPDEFEDQMWRKTAKNVAQVHEWIGYVQRVSPSTPLTDGHQRLYVIWLYRPEDTTISTTDYPVAKELFMSDNCNCHEHALLSSEVTRRCSVEWFSQGYDTRKEFLVRQKYETQTSSFVTMEKTDFRCSCRSQSSSGNFALNDKYRQGDTVYVREHDILNPVVIEELDVAEEQVKIRRLVRLNQTQTSDSHGRLFHGLPKRHIAANELAWTEDVETMSSAAIEDRCYVRFFSNCDITGGRVPFPYNQDGLGHCWIISMRLVMSNGQELEGLIAEELIAAPQCLREAPDYSPTKFSKKLSGLSLFSGLGNLDKGLEAGGAVQFHTAIDMNGRAIQTLRANAEEQLKLWFGSVDDYLHALLSGDSPNMKLIAKIGDVAVIAGGSPCPGFSKLQQNWLSEQSLRNAAHVTTFASFVDIYRPEYGYLENVVNMGVTRKGFEDELVLSQLIGCLVSMGYQVRQYIMSSWHFPSIQHRNRLFLSIAAPGRTPPAPPRATHGDPDGFKSKSVGKLLNGERFGVQDVQVTPFPQHVTPGEKLGHLPNIGSGIRHPCISSPDHVLRCRPNIREKRCMAHVPTDPPGVGIEYAAKRGLVPKYLYETRSEISKKSYRRIKKDGLVGTVVTAPSPHDSRAGPFVHWEQNRCITLEEARLTQGIPTEEVLIGSVSEQFKMVGNAVDRRVSEALGLELRRAMDQDAHRVAKKQSVSVVINVRRQSRVDVARPTTEGQTGAHIPAPLGVHQDVDTDYESDGSQTVRGLETCSGKRSRSTTQDDIHRSTTITSRSESGSNTNKEDEDDDGPVVRGRRRDAHGRLLYTAAVSREPTHESELGKQLEREFGFDLRVKPGGRASWNEKMVDYDASSAAPSLAMGRNGLPRHFKKALSAAPSRTKRSRDRSETDGESSSSSRSRLSSKKRVRQSESVESNHCVTVGSTDTSNTSENRRHGETSRKTRHSGLGLDFVPQQWHKRVENEARTKAREMSAKPKPRPYA
jgi:DNA (cytosine-5)-methyltransferase 1